MKLAVLFSGGKDSAYALFKAMKEHEILCLISVTSENPESYMFHVPNISITKLQARAISLPLVQKVTKGEKEKELIDLKAVIKQAINEYKIQGIVTGALASEYQSSRIQKICDELGLKCVNPLWRMDQEQLLNEVVAEGFEVIISGVYAYPLKKELVGRMIDNKVIKILVKASNEYDINPAGEGGEIETTVLNAPMFKQRIKIVESEVKGKDNDATLIIKKAELV